MANNHHKEVLDRLRRIEGQVRGIQKMVEEERYCIEVLTVLRSVVAALGKVEELILRRHLETCVSGAMRSGSVKEQDEKIDEVMQILSQFRR
ncbi:MAG: metal-sensitive transcriptional regulator [Candidatus Tectomicrobia bacterium]|uniref:Metal-sensitive transcriptional regulator n=1 Tax=Tectimicrobiota bacterium TaxID=2528274 RepID=A0A932GS07_UNCTE|nr:metal-sensitive transcriptional regulator [Candidatus Tectomicrobia bacterium]